MKKIKYNELSNTEIKLRIEVLENSFKSKKNELIKICEEMNNIEKEYLEAKHELEIRKNIYL